MHDFELFFLLLTRLDKYVRKMDILLIHSTFLHKQLQSDMANPKPAIKINAVHCKCYDHKNYGF